MSEPSFHKLFSNVILSALHILVMMTVLFSAYAQAQTASDTQPIDSRTGDANAQAPALEKKGSVQGPVVITADALSADKKNNNAVFEGNVIARNERMTLSADRMKVYYTVDGRLDRIDAHGKVRLVRDEQVLTSDDAEYFALTQVVIFTGNPRAIEGTNVLTGTKITYQMDEDRIMVESSRVFIDSDLSPSGREGH